MPTFHGQVQIVPSIVNPIEFAGWDDLVSAHPACGFFHTSAWAKVLCDTYGYNPEYFVLFKGESLVGLVPLMGVKSILTGRRGVSLPFTDFCEPIISDKSQFQALLQHIVNHGKRSGWKYIELRGGRSLLTDTVPSATLLGHTLDLLLDENKMLAGLRSSTKRNIKKALAEGVEVKILDSIEAVREFYRLNCMTRKQHGLPPQPYRFFEQVHKHVISQNLGVIVLAYLQNKVIAANVFFHFSDRAIYKYGASDRTYQNVRANNLVMWEAIKWCAHNGFKELSLGRTEPTHLGLRQFKTGWGAREQTVCYYNYNFKKAAFESNGSMSRNAYFNLLRRMPMFILSSIGSIGYRHAG